MPGKRPHNLYLIRADSASGFFNSQSAAAGLHFPVFATTVSSVECELKIAD
jgi:hypothetical protein